MSYATIEQYEARFGPVADTTMLQACIDDCTAAIDLRLDRAGIDHSDPDESFAYRLMSVCRSMANRLMPTGAGDVPVGVTQMGMTAGPYQQSWTFAASYGTPKPLPSELDMLGIPRSRIGCGKLAGE